VTKTAKTFVKKEKEKIFPMLSVTLHYIILLQKNTIKHCKNIFYYNQKYCNMNNILYFCHTTFKTHKENDPEKHQCKLALFH
jgi:hypothetical protein